MGLGADFMPRLAAWGAGLLVKSGALLVVVLAVHLLMRKARPALRCAWLQSGLLALLFLPLAAILQPVGQFAVLPPLPVANNVALAAFPRVSDNCSEGGRAGLVRPGLRPECRRARRDNPLSLELQRTFRTRHATPDMAWSPDKVLRFNVTL